MPTPPKLLVLDIGGTHVKALLPEAKEPEKLDSSPKLTPVKVVGWLRGLVGKQKLHGVSIGYPGVVVHNRIVTEPWNLGRGWVGFDFAKALGAPVRILNDAAMQALGSYRGGRMLFLGLGTGLGAAMIVKGFVEPLEIAHLIYRKERSYEDYTGRAALARMGKRKWRKHVREIMAQLRMALEPDEVVIGGGNAKKLGALPSGARLGDNRNAFTGGVKLWEEPIERAHP